jgi:hypothetical protein
MREGLPNEDDINRMIDQCIDDLCDDNAEHGADSLTELCFWWAKSGLGQESFENTRLFIINSSIERLGTSATSFIHYKLQVAEQQLRNQRSTTNGHSNIIIH